MRKRIYALATACAVLLVLAGPTEAASHRHRHRAHRVQVAEPSSQVLLSSMIAAADQWWTLQGSPPPCAGSPVLEWGTVDDVHQGFAFYRSCTMMISPYWWATQYAFLTSDRPARARRRAAAFDVALLMHERGHNIGYDHIPGTVMQAETPVVPGWAFGWAEQMVR